ncbi:MAG: bifunctional adenosylcobinamide kinase/adenosylcobinamide-phosphate guanylyltransferase [Chloroflexi bacterium]|nr:bifunctional adenosylcobinamide kinase/adenosylcobinamide-phosphate guanylyltransferase [Chloroflexota bacterium]
MNKRFVFILGGARSGKTRHALELAPQLGARVTYLATAEPGDDEMRTRIAHHRTERPAHWQTIEAARNIGDALARVDADVVLLDCITLLVTNAMLAAGEHATFEEQQACVNAEIEALLAAYRAGNFTLVAVSNEVGLGVVPEYPLGRAYRDLLGWANQHLARAADEALFMVAGLAMKVKG